MPLLGTAYSVVPTELLSIFNTKIIKYLSSNTSCFNVCQATCFGPYMTIIRPIYVSS